MAIVQTFLRSAAAFLALVERIPGERWAAPGLGVWTVRDLVGHTARAISTVEDYLSAPAPPTASITDAAAYYGAILGQVIDHSEIADRGIKAGLALGDDPPRVIAAAIERAAAAIAQAPSGRIVAIGPVSIPLREYLRTRVFELVVHSLDIARATGLDDGFPEKLVSEAVTLGARTAARRGDGRPLLLALSGRGELPKGFTVV